MKNQINVFPKATEKAYGQSKKNIYVFDAPVGSNKNEIAAAVETQYGVKVVNVKTLVQNGKAVRVSRGKRAMPATMHRKDSKKAYVMLAKGDSIKVFNEEVAAPETKDVKASKDTKVTVKTEKKEKK